MQSNKEIVEALKTKLFKEEKTMRGFHRECLAGAYDYWHFVKQVAFPDSMLDGMREAILGYLVE